jgi:hypothetical protein
MWIGLQRRTDFAIAWRAFAPDSDSLHGKTFVENDEGRAWERGHPFPLTSDR